MSSSTPNIGLTLPTGGERVSRQIINENNTKIDTYAGELSEQIGNNITSLYALNSLYYGTVQTTDAGNEITLNENWDNYRVIFVILLSASDIILASTIVPSEHIEVLNSNVYASYYSDSQTVVYTNFNRTNKNKVNVWSNNSNAKKIRIYGMMKKI